MQVCIRHEQRFTLMKCAVQYMDKLNVLFKAYDFILSNPKTRRSAISWIFIDGRIVYAVICGYDARRASNALYHALRAVGRNGVKRTAGGKGCWVVSYV